MRNAESLAQAAADCAERGSRALIAPADVTDPEAVEDAARRTVDRFGRIDAWVNAASVMAFGSFLDVPLDDVRRVLDVNVMGYVHGCRAALPRMIERDRGVIVNVSSILGVVAAPFVSSYAMSKFAVRGLGVSLRQELRLAGIRGVEVCTVLPAAIDTPIWENAANHSGRRARALPPVYTPERVARIIVNQIRVPRREVVAGGLLGRAFLLHHKVLPGPAERVLAEEMDRLGLSRTEPAPDSTGNLYRPTPGPGRIHGGWQGRRRERRRRAAGLAAAAGVTAAARR
ncbi:SDR family NAD(P)-dependent oxidoreductase [Pseudonocardia bannensis]|uniref:SDR family NAD(P)-dependent oxidoreductase n=1 Tax=Pseudonocardia bannensis TaxID=630973 RepID=A0A848DHE4_9PSEU|nr:SDR family NAD(P)-dependent oxidoreductase [Pseudonocardia bannensis]NMH91931.1 SDR family NAD(P)-dependent oxidoreductase [Pseudonocardia bannensis]